MYPVAYSAKYEAEGRNRLTVLFRLIVALPWAIWGALWGFVVSFSVIIAWFAVLFTGRYPQALYDFHASYTRFMARFHGFYSLMTDEWPSFNGEPDDSYPVRLLLPEPKKSYSRVKVFFRIILMIPVMILAWIMGIILELVGFILWIVMIFTAKMPEGLYKPMRAANAYVIKALPFFLLMTEDFPPFWTDEADELPAFGADAAPAPPAPAAPAA